MPSSWWANAASSTRHSHGHALCDAEEIACGNVPELPDLMVIGLDASESMPSLGAVTAAAVTSKVRFVDLVALFAAAKS